MICQALGVRASGVCGRCRRRAPRSRRTASARCSAATGSPRRSACARWPSPPGRSGAARTPRRPGSRGPFSSRVTCTVIGEVALDLVGVGRQALAQAGSGGDLVAQVEDRVAQLGDHAGHLLAQLADLLLLAGVVPSWRRGCRPGSRARRRPGRPRRGPRGRSAGAPGSWRCRGPGRTAALPAAGPRGGRAGSRSSRAAAGLDGVQRVERRAPRSSRRWRSAGWRRAARAASSPRTPSTSPRAARPRPSRRAGCPTE